MTVETPTLENAQNAPNGINLCKEGFKGGAILIIVVVLFCGIRACSGRNKGNSGDEQKTTSEDQGNVPSSPTTISEPVRCVSHFSFFPRVTHRLVHLLIFLGNPHLFSSVLFAPSHMVISYKNVK